MTKLASFTFAAVLGLSSLALPIFLTDAPPPTPVVSERIDSADQTTEQTINGLFAAISLSKRLLPVWALDAANKAVTHWKLHRLSQKTAEIEKEVVAVLRIVADIKDQAEAGRAMSERETRLTRELLDTHGRRLDDLAPRVDEIERETKDLKAQVDFWKERTATLEKRNKALEERNRKMEIRFFRSCGFGRAWRNGRCEDAAADPR